MEAIINNLTKAIGWSILHSLWQGAIIFSILFIVLMAWPKMSARLKHNLAFGSLFLIFSSFCFTFFSIFEFPQANHLKAIALNQIAYQDLSQFANSFNLKTEAYFPVVVIVYVIGIIFQLIVLLSGYVKLKKLKKASIIPIPSDWIVIFEMTLFQLKINKKVSFYLSEKVNVPLVIGFFKPVVLFPFSLATQLDAKQVEAILIHELSHIRRNDYLINLVKTFIETLLFFNPFVWLTTRFIQIEREHACDDLVVKATGTPLTYAHALLKLELLKDKQSPALSLAATGKNQHLYQRIKRITDMKTNYINAKQQFFILTLAIATVASLAWINPTKKQEVKAEKKTKVTLLKPSILEDKSLNKHLVVRADTDSTKVKRKAKIIITDNNGNVKTYNSIKEMPDSLRKTVERQIYVGDSISAYYNSPVFKAKIAEVEKNALALSKKYESKEWKDQMAKIQENALAIAKKYDSKEWKDQMAKIQEHSLAIAKKYESKEWKDQVAKIQENALAIAKKYDSKEWKDQMAKVQEHSLALAKKYESKEWKDNMSKIQKNAEEIQKKYNSPEWKQKIEELKKLQESPEYKELRKKYESDLEELKKKKGIKTDKAFLLFDGGNIDKAFLPFAGDLKTVFATALPLTLKSINFKLDELPGIEVMSSPTLKLATPLTTPAKVKVN